MNAGTSGIIFASSGIVSGDRSINTQNSNSMSASTNMMSSNTYHPGNSTVPGSTLRHQNLNSRNVGNNSQFCVLWNNYHGSLVSTVGMLRREGLLLDCTMASTDGGRINVHQLILAACSAVCRDLFKDCETKHPIILLPSDISIHELRAMVEFMYTGQVCIEQERLKAFIHGARYLRIKGLEDNSDDTDAEYGDLVGEGNCYKADMGEESKTDILARSVELSVSERKDDNDKDNWQVVERKPIILPHSRSISPGGSRKRRRLNTSRRRPMHLSSSIVCYEQEPGFRAVPGRLGGSSAYGRDRHTLSEDNEPINKIRRMSTQQGHFHDDLEICTCSSRKTWSVADTEALLRAWGETLTQVPPSYFIRSMSLCKRVARNLQARGVQKNWRQCQVKMKNLRREVRLFKESRSRLSGRKTSEVANACEKLLPEIEEIFNKEEEIRQEWYQLKTDDRQREDGNDDEPQSPHQRDILARVAVLADSDLGDEDTDCAGLETEGEDGVHNESQGACVDDEDMVGLGVEVTTASTGFEEPHHSVHHQPDGTIHHIVEDVSMQH